MLTGDLFIISETIIKSENEYVFIFNCNVNHPIFEGHFPGQPVLPGVCMTQFVRESLSSVLKKEFHLAQSKSIKFVNVVDPRKENKLFLEIRILPNHDGYTEVSASIKSEQASFFQIKGKYTAL